jgi:hypothetical protein
VKETKILVFLVKDPIDKVKVRTVYALTDIMIILLILIAKLATINVKGVKEMI